MKEITTEEFASEVLEAKQPVLVDFWGPSCAPCLALMPFVEELAAKNADRLKVVKVNAKENRKLCVQLRVLGLPSFLLFNDGNEITRISGDVNQEAIAQLVDEAFV